MNNKNFRRRIIEIYDNGDGILPCNRDCDANKLLELIEDYQASLKKKRKK